MEDTEKGSTLPSDEDGPDVHVLEEIDPRDLPPMFGSLLSVAEAPEETKVVLTKDWWHIIRKWYPGLLHTIYCVPPVHFYAVTYKEKESRPQFQEPYERFGMTMFLPMQYTKVVDDEAQQRVLHTLQTYLKKIEAVCFILSNVEFQNYLNKEYTYSPEMKEIPKLNQNDEGEVDVIIIDKGSGIYVLEVKGTGYRHHAGMTLEEKMPDCLKPLEKIMKQLPRAENVVRRILIDLDPQGKIKIRKGFLMPNLEREVLQKILKNHPIRDQKLQADLGAVCQELQAALRAVSREQLADCCLTATEMPEKNTPPVDTMTGVTLKKIDHWWKTLQAVSGEMECPIENEVYEQLVARFCGHLTTVKIYTEKTMPRVRLRTVMPVKKKKKKSCDPKVYVDPFECRTLAGAAREIARRFSELVLLPEQIDLLQSDEDFVHLEGPPGTGKTLMLLLRVLTWLDRNNMVWMLSLSAPSRSIIHVLYDQARKMVIEHKGKDKAPEILKRMRIFIMTRPEKTLDAKYFERRLHKWRLRAKLKDSEINWGYPRPPTLPPVAPLTDRKVCLILDETGMSGKGLKAFFDQVAVCHREKCFTSEEAEFTAGLTVWSASVEKCGRPCYVRDPETEPYSEEKFGVYRHLKMPLRCPPTVQRALMLVQPKLDENNVFLFQKGDALPNPANPADPLGKGCYQYHADGLPVFLIGHGAHEKADKPVWLCKQCGQELAKFLKGHLRIGEDERVVSDVPLQQKDVLIVGTHGAFNKSIVIGGFFAALVKNGLKVGISASREEGDAALTGKDTMLVADVTTIHGLERAVVVVVPEVPGSQPPGTTSNQPGTTATPAQQQQTSTTQPQQQAASPSREQQIEKMDVDDIGQEYTTAAELSTSITNGGPEGSHEAMETEDPNPDQDADSDPDEDAETWYAAQNALASPSADTKPRERKAESKPKQSADNSAASQQMPFFDARSESEIGAALGTLTEQAQKDVFYIGSRAVCQLIVIHFGPVKKIQ